jgi:hypothetical protein
MTAMETPPLPRILLFTGTGWISRAIRWQTRSAVNHAAIQLPNGEIIEAWEGAGVQRTTLKSTRGIQAYTVEGMKPAQWQKAVEFAHAQVGKKYDYWAVLTFISRRKAPSNDKWFCSELVFESLQEAGVHLLRRIPPNEVSPGHLLLSPLLTPTNILPLTPTASPRA